MSEPKDYEAMPLYEKLSHLQGKLDDAYRSDGSGVDEWYDPDVVQTVSGMLENLEKEVFAACRDRGYTL